MKYLFLDTNIYLHYQDFQQIPWKKVLGIDDECTVVVVLIHKNGRFYGQSLQKSTAVHENGSFYGLDVKMSRLRLR